MGFMGYRRPDGSFGVRNHVVVLPSVSCANGVVQQIGRRVPGVKAITHPEGCGRGFGDVVNAWRTLVGVALNPNVAACLIVGLGCEVIKASGLYNDAVKSGKRIEFFDIQDVGGSIKAAEKGAAIAREMLAEAERFPREEAGFEHLTVAVECGGSDSFSGLTANPTVGIVADWVVAQGGCVLLSETTELIGTEELVSTRIQDPQVLKKFDDLMRRQRDKVNCGLGEAASSVIAPGNQEGGLTSIIEKSLGCVRKGGSTAIRDVIEYAERPQKKGLVIMDTPGSDIFSMTGKIAGGAQIVLFTTGRGSPAGSPIAPVIKIASNSDLFARMPDDMDFDAGRIQTGMTVDECGADLIDLMRRVASGKPVKPELTQTELFSIHSEGPAY